MQNSVLYPNIIDATANIIKKFGKDIIHEDRFVNALSDLSPGRNEPAVFKIIKSSIQDGLLKPILAANAKSIEHQIATTTAALNKQYGYDQSLVEGILFSLAIGYGTISITQYNAIKALNNRPAKKQTTQPSQNSNPNKPSKQKNNPTQPPAKYESTLKNVVILIWGMFGLLVSPLFYAYQISENSWWPMGASIVLALIQMVTVLPVSISFGSDNSINNCRIHPALHGGFCALYMFAIAFWIVFPFIWSFESIQSYWGFIPNKEAFPWILTWFANIFCAMLLGVALDQGVSSFSNTWHKNKGKFFDNFQDLMKERPYRNGYFAVSAIFVITAFIFYCIPLVKESQYKNKIREYNIKIEKHNQYSDSIKNARIQNERNISFALFKLGDSYSSCISKIKGNDNYDKVESVSYHDYLTIKGIDYISIVDSILQVKTNWNNEDIKVKLYFAKQSLIAIQFSPEETNGDSILASYTAKYGEPESPLEKISSQEYNLPAYDYSMNYSMIEDKLIPEHFFWTYKNSLITIDYYKHRSYSYSVMMPAEGIHITYFDRQAESLLQQYNEEQTRKAREYQKRQNDSLRLVREAEERQRQEQRRQEELNHQRSMEQI